MGALWIEFDNVEHARAWRAGAGGWLFLVERSPSVIWFDRGFTPTHIFCHPRMRGLSGALI